jgi:hypothetical protein
MGTSKIRPSVDIHGARPLRTRHRPRPNGVPTCVGMSWLPASSWGGSGHEDLGLPTARRSASTPASLRIVGPGMPCPSPVPSMPFLTTTTACSVLLVQVCCTLLPTMRFAWLPSTAGPQDRRHVQSEQARSFHCCVPAHPDPCADAEASVALARTRPGASDSLSEVPRTGTCRPVRVAPSRRAERYPPAPAGDAEASPASSGRTAVAETPFRDRSLRRASDLHVGDASAATRSRLGPPARCTLPRLSLRRGHPSKLFPRPQPTRITPSPCLPAVGSRPLRAIPGVATLHPAHVSFASTSRPCLHGRVRCFGPT